MTTKSKVAPAVDDAAMVVAASVITTEQSIAIARIDERTKYLVEALPNLVTQAEFKPVKQVVYGLVGSALLALVGAIIATVLI